MPVSLDFFRLARVMRHPSLPKQSRPDHAGKMAQATTGSRDLSALCLFNTTALRRSVPVASPAKFTRPAS